MAALTGLTLGFGAVPHLLFQYADPLLAACRWPARLFDLGVMMLVVGATVLMLIALAHQSIRTPRIVEAAREADADTDAAPAPDPQDAEKEAAR